VQLFQDLLPVQGTLAAPQQIEEIYHGDHRTLNRNDIVLVIPMSGDVD
jgi:hypothetical protein